MPVVRLGIGIELEIHGSLGYFVLIWGPFAQPLPFGLFMTLYRVFLIVGTRQSLVRIDTVRQPRMVDNEPLILLFFIRGLEMEHCLGDSLVCLDN